MRRHPAVDIRAVRGHGKDMQTIGFAAMMVAARVAIRGTGGAGDQQHGQGRGNRERFAHIQSSHFILGPRAAGNVTG
jgi:hypothetical protein